MALSMVVPGGLLSGSSVFAEVQNETVRGAGTEADPYLITKPEDLKVLEYNGSKDYVHAKLANDIVLPNDGKNEVINFYGILDGDNHSIVMTGDSKPMIHLFEGGEVKNINQNVESFSSLIYSLSNEVTREHKLTNINVTGSFDLTADDNNESPLVIYPSGDITMDGINMNVDLTSPTYNGLLIGYAPCKGSNYVFRNINISGNYIGSNLGVLFGNAAKMGGDFSVAYLYKGKGDPDKANVAVENLNITGKIVSTKSKSKMLAAESFDPKIDGKLEEELMSKVTGTENLLQATLVSGYTGKLDSNGKLKIVSNNGDEKVDHIVVNAELYSYVYDMKNKYEYDGTNKFAVS